MITHITWNKSQGLALKNFRKIKKSKEVLPIMRMLVSDAVLRNISLAYVKLMHTNAQKQIQFG